MAYQLTARNEAELQGQVERITFVSEENGYTVLKLKVGKGSGLVTVVGNLLGISPGEVLNLKGQWDSHPKFGEQFKVKSYDSIVPATVNGIKKYLGSGLIKGIGPKLATRLVDKFGEETLDIIESSSERLSEVDGIGVKRVHMIKSAWTEHKEIKNINMFLCEHEISTNYANKIYIEYGKTSIAKIKENPYRLASDINGIGFATADKIAQKIGFDLDSEFRAQAGIIYTLNQLSNEGHVYYPYEQLIKECLKLLSISRETIVKAFGTIAYEKEITIEDIGETKSGNEPEHNLKAVYLKKFYVCETLTAINLKYLYSQPKNIRNFDHNKAIDWVQKELKISLHQLQIEAVKQSFDNKILVITGGPGTGKTTILNCIIKIYKQLKQKVLLTAPTGRAAKRLSETTGCDAKTIHRLLDFSFKDGGFNKNDTEKLDGSLIIVDEVSMVDVVLMHHLVKAIHKSGTLILVGDVDQLPSVGAGCVLKDIIDSEIFPTVKLTEIFRQSKTSQIVINAHKINNGQSPVLLNKDTDFMFFEAAEPEEVLEEVVQQIIEKIPSQFAMDSFKDIQIMAPMNRGTIGVSKLNLVLQEVMNKDKTQTFKMGRIFKKGDKVMQIVNNYDKDVYNGDIGIITKINDVNQELTISYDGRQVTYDYKELDEVTLAYAISVHKSQGSEYPVVIIPIHTQHYMMLQRNLLYTAITRGKKLVVLVGTKKALFMAIRNNKQKMRYTMLTERLKETEQQVLF